MSDGAMSRHRPGPAENAFEYAPFASLFVVALRDAADRKLDERERKAAARAVVFLLREQLITERIASDVLTAIRRSLDLSAVVRTLLIGLRDTLGDHERASAWTAAAADRALAEGQLPSFISAMRILVELRGYDGVVPTRWRLSIVRAAEVRELAPRVLILARAYTQRFPRESWRWIRMARVRSTIASLRRRATAADFEEAGQS